MIGRFSQQDRMIGRFSQQDRMIGRFSQEDRIIGRFSQDDRKTPWWKIPFFENIFSHLLATKSNF